MVAVTLTSAAPAAAQQLIEYTPNVRAPWTFDRWHPAMVLSHRFEILEGGDELVSIPTVTVGSAIGARFALGLDYTSNSEVTAEALGGNEIQWWAAFQWPSAGRAASSALLAYNTAANSFDGAVTGKARVRAVSLVAEARAFSDAFATGDLGFAGAGGLVLHLTDYLSISGDVARAFSPDSFGTAWSGAFAVAFPGTRHHFSFQATNSGALTLQGVSRRKAYGPAPVRYGFAFVAPLGTPSQWSRIFGRGRPPTIAPDSAMGTVRVNIKDLAFSPSTVRIKVGQTVEWMNGDPFVHTATADDKSWGSEFINQGGRYARKFESVGSFEYHCEPHPQMRGKVIVEQ